MTNKGSLSVFFHMYASSIQFKEKNYETNIESTEQHVVPSHNMGKKSGVNADEN